MLCFVFGNEHYPLAIRRFVTEAGKAGKLRDAFRVTLVYRKQWPNPFCQLPARYLSPRVTLKAFFMLSEKEVKQEYQRKADIAAANVKYAINKPLAVHTFLRYLFLSI